MSSTSRTFTTPSSRWSALTTRDPLSDTHFVYGVLTTKIFCRPICPARLARRANVTFFDTPAEAIAAGFRACKRCKPDTGPENVPFESVDEMKKKRKEGVKRAVRLMKRKGGAGLSLEQVAKVAGIGTKWHFLRVFRDVMGETPGAVMARLRDGGTIDDAEAEKIDSISMSNGIVPSDASAIPPGLESELLFGHRLTDTASPLYPSLPSFQAGISPPFTGPLTPLDTAWLTDDPLEMDKLLSEVFSLDDYNPNLSPFLPATFLQRPDDFTTNPSGISPFPLPALAEFQPDAVGTEKFSFNDPLSETLLMSAPATGLEDWSTSTSDSYHGLDCKPSTANAPNSR